MLPGSRPVGPPAKACVRRDRLTNIACRHSLVSQGGGMPYHRDCPARSATNTFAPALGRGPSTTRRRSPGHLLSGSRVRALAGALTFALVTVALIAIGSPAAQATSCGNFSCFILHTVTPIYTAPPGTWVEWILAPYNGDGQPDLWGIYRPNASS